MTGWAQVNGRNAITWEQKFLLDEWYVDHQTIFVDLKILFKTIWLALTSQGISQPGYATAEEFHGFTDDQGVDGQDISDVVTNRDAVLASRAVGRS
jgi:sugar transferase EpsL